ncbi:MAG: ATP synthase F1 subunit delta [Solirubrobacteraceae bacterium]|nr:MAG: ATP synthase F1 subunit delta [Solirubrobacterales bacterium]
MQEIAEVYARSLFEVAVEHDNLDKVREQLGQFADALGANRELGIFFFSPYFSPGEKKEGLAKGIDGAEESLMHFLELLIDKHRMPVIFRIRRRVDELWEAENRRLPVEVTSAIALDEKLVEAIGERIGEQTGRRVELTATVEPAILGGLVLQVGNSILDASIRNRLDQLRHQVAR